MQIVIKIDEDTYNDLRYQKQYSPRFLSHYERMIVDGTPLPKGHGDLKDAKKLKNAFVAWSMAVHGNFTDADIASIIYNSPTIIEADKDKEVNADADSN